MIPHGGPNSFARENNSASAVSCETGFAISGPDCLEGSTSRRKYKRMKKLTQENRVVNVVDMLF